MKKMTFKKALKKAKVDFSFAIAPVDVAYEQVEQVANAGARIIALKDNFNCELWGFTKSQADKICYAFNLMAEQYKNVYTIKVFHSAADDKEYDKDSNYVSMQ